MADSRGPMVISVTWVFTSLVIIVVAIRFYVRIKILNKLGADDWLMLLAACLQVAAQGAVTEGYLSGLGQHSQDLTENQVQTVTKMDLVFTTPAILASITARISICVLMLKLFATKKWFMWYLYIITVLQTIAEILVIVFVWAMCTPVQALWTPELIESGAAQCWNPAIEQDAAYLGQAIFTLNDLTLVVFPVWIVWKLRMSLKNKLGLIFVLSLGIFTMTASIMKTVTSASPSTDSSYGSVGPIIWSTIEQCLVIVMGSIPPLRAIAKIQFPSLRSIGYSMRNMLSTRSRTIPADGQLGTATHIDAAGADKGSDTRALVYENLELGASQASWLTKDGKPVAGVREADRSLDRSDDYQTGSGFGPLGGIQRSDGFAVSYDRSMGAHETV
ncbi:hypothetical protein MMC27_001839 [Xylographa pallens]|nr:hypothetical protein [Xylographa pallens]